LTLLTALFWVISCIQIKIAQKAADAAEKKAEIARKRAA